MCPQPINAAGQTSLEIGRCTGCSLGSYLPLFSEGHRRLDRADENRIDEFVVMHMQDVAREQTLGDRIRRIRRGPSKSSTGCSRS